MRASLIVQLLLLLSGVTKVKVANGLDNGIRTPPMGWSSWYGFTTHISEDLIVDQARGMVQSGLAEAGYEYIWIDDGWIIGRDSSGKPLEDHALFPSGMANVSAYVHSLGLKFGIYTSKGPLTCLGYQADQPDRPGSCGYERIDAQVYANEWQVDAVKDDGCGDCPGRDPFAAMSKELNETGRRVFLSIHGDKAARPEYASVANMWRVGDDLFDSSFDMWTNRLDLATSDDQAALVGPGRIANPDFLEVGYSPIHPKGKSGIMTPLEMRSMFTMWAALPGPLVLSADLRPNASCGGISDASILDILTNPEVIAINQDDAVQPMRPIMRQDGTEVWRKSLADDRKVAIVFFFRGVDTTGPMPEPPEQPRSVGVSWSELGYPNNTKITVRDLWRRKRLGMFQGNFRAKVRHREALIYVFSQTPAMDEEQERVAIAR